MIETQTNLISLKFQTKHKTNNLLFLSTIQSTSYKETSEQFSIETLNLIKIKIFQKPSMV